VIEQVLSSDDEHGVAVFVLPTKALVNQVQAQVYKDFGTVFGVFTRDYRYRPLNCRVLITVPACLEILVLSPANRTWVENIKFCIFDEVHCVAEADGGILERTMLYMPCPILALSATIGNVKEFHSWMQQGKDMQKQQDIVAGTVKDDAHYKVSLVVHTERWSDLHYACFPCPDMPTDEDLEQLEMVPMHPITALSTGRIASDGWGAISLTPSDSLSLFDTMCAVAGGLDEPQKSETLAQLEEVNPQTFFSGVKRIIHSETRTYEARIKAILQAWAHNSPQLCDLVLAHYDGTVEHVDHSAANIFQLCDSFSPLLHSLRARGNLPALVFNFDRAGCLKLLKRAVEDLEHAEFERRNKYWEQLEEVRSRQGKLEKAAEKAAAREQKQKKDDDDDAGGSAVPYKAQQYIKVDGFEFSSDESLPDPDFSYCSMQDRRGEESLNEIIRNLRLDKNDLLVRALRRGLGMHHSGLPTKYRQAVEILFREKHLKVVVATGTLAYGIHMPCKAVVFAGESVFLNAIQFRQMSGRAGRRGFDSTGEIVFFGLPFTRCTSLLLAPLPNLRGRFPISLSRVLRLLQLQAELGNPNSQFLAPAETQQVALANSLRTLENSLMCHADESKQRQAKLVFTATLRTLVRLEMVDAEGVPIGLAGLASHLFWTEPANFALVKLIQAGVFHRVIATAQHASLEIVRLISHLFCKVEVHPSLIHQIEVHGHSGPSMVLLEPLPEWIAEILTALERDCLYTFVGSLSTDCTEADSCAMPFSNRNLRTENNSNVVLPTQVNVLEPRVASAFVALSGHADEFASAKELAVCCRQDLALQPHMVPTFSPSCQNKPLNSYILDFCKHGQKKELVRGNCIPESMAFEQLKTFSGILRATATCLQHLGEVEPELSELVPYFDNAATEFKEAFDLFNMPQFSTGLSAGC
jgi:hypothetical protein